MCTLVLWLGQIWHFLPVCHILSAVWRSGVLQHSAHSGRQIHSTKSWTHTIQTAAHYWFCVFVSEWVYVCVPVHHKSSAWPDTVVCSSWRWLQCPPQKLPAETVSANKNHQKQTNKHHAADLTTWSVCETILSLLAPRKFPMRVPKTSPAYISANQTPARTTAALKVCLNILLVPVFFKALLTVRNKSHSQAVFLKAEWLQPVVWLSWMYFTLL